MSLQDAKIRLLLLQRLVTGDSNTPESPRWWKTVSAIVIPVPVAALCAVVLWTYVPPVVDYPIFLLATFGLILLGMAWLAAAIWGVTRYRSYLRSAIAPAIVVATMILTTANVPFNVGFYVSKGELTRASVDCMPESSGWIGAYEVVRVDSREGGCLFFTKGGLVNPVGLAYMPEGVPNLGPPRHGQETGTGISTAIGTDSCSAFSPVSYLSAYFDAKTSADRHAE